MKFLIYVPILALFAAAAFGSETIDEQASFAKGGRLIVSNVAGSVEIEGWDREQIVLTGQLGDKSELVFEVDGTTARVEVEADRDKRDRRDGDWDMEDSELVIRVPRATRISATTVSADLDVTGIEALQRLQTVSGDLRAEVFADEVEAKTVSGEIEIAGRGQRTRLTVAAVSGDIEIEAVAGEVAVSTVSGDADVSAGALDRLRAKSVSGDVELTADLAEDGRIDVESLSGEVRLRLASLYDAEYRLRSFSGNIGPVLGQDAAKQSRFGPGWKLEMTEGAGSRRIDIETMSGDIDIVATGRDDRDPDVQRPAASENGD